MPGPCSGGCPVCARAGAVVEASVPAKAPEPRARPVAGADFRSARRVRPSARGAPRSVFAVIRYQPPVGTRVDGTPRNGLRGDVRHEEPETGAPRLAAAALSLGGADTVQCRVP